MKNSLLLSASAFLMISTTASHAASNEINFTQDSQMASVTFTQDGTGNIVNKTGIAGGEATTVTGLNELEIEQIGDSNTVALTSTSAQKKVDIEQTGTSNTVSLTSTNTHSAGEIVLEFDGSSNTFTGVFDQVDAKKTEFGLYVTGSGFKTNADIRSSSSSVSATISPGGGTASITGGELNITQAGHDATLLLVAEASIADEKPTITTSQTGTGTFSNTIDAEFLTLGNPAISITQIAGSAGNSYKNRQLVAGGNLTVRQTN